MKYYDYKQNNEKLRTEIFDKHGVFFAFGQKQFDKQKRTGVKYLSLGSGMVIPKDNHESFMNECMQLDNDFVTKAKELFTPAQIIGYELANHEYCITYDLEDTKDALEEFKFSDDDYRIAIKEYLDSCEY